MAEAIQAMGYAGLDTARLEAQYVELDAKVVLVDVPCIVCRRMYPVAVAVANNAMPQTGLCKDCDDRVQNEVGYLRDNT
jgi:hypothetical protein